MKNYLIIFSVLFSFIFLSGCMSKSFYANTPEGYGDLAKNYAEKGSIDEAVKILVNAIDAYGSQSEDAVIVTMSLGEIYRDYSKDYTLALRTFERAYLNYPQTEQAPYGLYEAAKIAEENFRDFSKAKQDYKKVIDMYPTSKIRDNAYTEYHRLLQMGY